MYTRIWRRQRRGCVGRIGTFLDVANVPRRSYTSPKGSDAQAPTQTIAGFFRKLIQNETKALAESINRNFADISQNYDTTIAWDMDPKLHHDLTHTMDNNHKLFLMLSHNPVLVNPHMYIDLYETLENPLDNSLRTLLLRRLLFHRQYEQCWKICLDTYTSLTEIEDFLDLAFGSFEEYNHLAFGPFELLVASQSDYFNRGFKNHIIDTCCLKYKISKTWINNSLQTWFELQNLQTLEDINAAFHPSKLKNVNVQMAYLRRVFEITKSENDVSPLLNENIDIRKYPGWLSAVGPSFSQASYLPYRSSTYSQHPSIHPQTPPIATALAQVSPKSLSINDVVYTIRSNSAYDPFALCQTYVASNKNLNRHVINYLTVEIINSSPIVCVETVLADQNLLLEDSTLADSLLRVCLESKPQLSSLFSYIPPERKETVTRIFVEKYVEQKPGVDDLHRLIRYLHSLFNMKAIRLVLARVSEKYSRDEHLELCRLIAYDTTILSKRTLSELLRSILLRCKVTEGPLIGDVFEKLLTVTLKKHIILKRPNEYKPKNQPHDLQKLFNLANADEKAHFHNIIRALGQTISLMQPKLIAQAIDTLHDRVHSEGFTFTSSKFGKNYLMNNIITEIMKFTERTNQKKTNQKETEQTMDETNSTFDPNHSSSLKNPILKTRDILKHLCERPIQNDQVLPSSLVQASLFKIMIKDDPMKSVKLINIYKSNKAQISGKLTFIIIGILTSAKLDVNQRIQLFQQFLTELKALNYRHRIRQSVIYEIMKIIKNEKRNLSQESKTWLLEFLQGIKGTKRVVDVRMKSDMRKKKH